MSKYADNVIDFSQKENNQAKTVEEKILEIMKKSEEQRNSTEFFPVILLKNLDQITNSEVEKLLLSLLDPPPDTNL
ncbi:13933_t:CDS:2 [Entrophospora sp. SA101]|nr:13933_t:CDS:2 [Entrophospora sp. SA101]